MMHCTILLFAQFRKREKQPRSVNFSKLAE